MQRSQLEGPVGGGDGVLGLQGPRAPTGHGHIGVTRRPRDLRQQELELGAGELPVTH